MIISDPSFSADDNFMKNFWKQGLGDGSVMQISWKQKVGDVKRGRCAKWTLRLCSSEECKELDSYLHVPRAAIVFCKSVRVF